MSTHTCRHTLIHGQTHMHTHGQTHAHRYTHAHTHRHTHAHRHTLAHTYTLMGKHTYTGTHTLAEHPSPEPALSPAPSQAHPRTLVSVLRGLAGGKCHFGPITRPLSHLGTINDKFNFHLKRRGWSAAHRGALGLCPKMRVTAALGAGRGQGPPHHILGFPCHGWFE